MFWFSILLYIILLKRKISRDNFRYKIFNSKFEIWNEI
jgi:hypothetical protein